jgi:hypothetical protein
VARGADRAARRVKQQQQPVSEMNVPRWGNWRMVAAVAMAKVPVVGGGLGNSGARGVENDG